MKKIYKTNLLIIKKEYLKKYFDNPIIRDYILEGLNEDIINEQMIYLNNNNFSGNNYKPLLDSTIYVTKTLFENYVKEIVTGKYIRVINHSFHQVTLSNKKFFADTPFLNIVDLNNKEELADLKNYIKNSSAIKNKLELVEKICEKNHKEEYEEYIKEKKLNKKESINQMKNIKKLLRQNKK